MVAMKRHLWDYGTAGHGLVGSYFFRFIIAKRSVAIIKVKRARP